MLNLTTMVVAAVLVVLAVVITLNRVMSLRKMAKYGVALDVVFTVAIAALMGGTLQGIVIAIMAGLCMALFLLLLKRWFRVRDAYCNAVVNEFDENGVWIYNKPPYLHPGELAT